MRGSASSLQRRTDLHTAEQDGRGIFPMERSEGDAAGGKPWPVEGMLCTGKVLCAQRVQLAQIKKARDGVAAGFIFILAIKNLHKCSTLIMGCILLLLLLADINLWWSEQNCN